MQQELTDRDAKERMNIKPLGRHFTHPTLQWHPPGDTQKLNKQYYQIQMTNIRRLKESWFLNENRKNTRPEARYGYLRRLALKVEKRNPLAAANRRHAEMRESERQADNKQGEYSSYQAAQGSEGRDRLRCSDIAVRGILWKYTGC